MVAKNKTEKEKEEIMHDSKIEWVLNPDNKTLGKIWNPITGCLNGCPYCYARKLANTRLKETYLANKKIATLLTGLDIMECSKALRDPFYPRLWPDRLNEDLGICKGIFVVDMGDLFGIGVPEEWTGEVLDRIRRSSHRNRYYLLTKQPQNLIKFSPFPDNVYIGVTATNQTMHNEAIVCLSGIEAKVKYISYEPLLNQIVPVYAYGLSEINWVIIGAQTKPTVYPKLEWVKEIVEAADNAGIPVFLKDNLKPLLGDNLRQEMPK